MFHTSAYDDPDPTLYPFDAERSAAAPVAEPVSAAGGCLLVLAVATGLFLIGAAFEWFCGH